MWQGHRRDHRHLLECVRLEHFHSIQSANCDVSKLTVRVTSKVDVIGDRSRVEHFDDVERWPCVKHHGLADVLECEPDMLTIRCRCDVGAERAYLFHLPDDLMLGGGNNDGFRTEARANISIFSVRRKYRHTRAVWHGDAGPFLESLAIENCDIVLAADADPNLFAVGRKERFVR